MFGCGLSSEQMEIFSDFGALGLWFWNNGTWTQVSGLNTEFMVPADTDGNGKDELIGDWARQAFGYGMEPTGPNSPGLIRRTFSPKTLMAIPIVK